MREIKFRAWDKRNKFMLTEGFTLSHDGRQGVFFSADNAGVYPKTSDPYDLIPMQYTGLKDKNGVEIYEGDILTVTDEGDELQHVVKYENGGYFINEIDWDYNPSIGSPGLELEVIGNIYENKELLK